MDPPGTIRFTLYQQPVFIQKEPVFIQREPVVIQRETVFIHLPPRDELFPGRSSVDECGCCDVFTVVALAMIAVLSMLTYGLMFYLLHEKKFA